MANDELLAVLLKRVLRCFLSELDRLPEGRVEPEHESHRLFRAIVHSQLWHPDVNRLMNQCWFKSNTDAFERIVECPGLAGRVQLDNTYGREIEAEMVGQDAGRPANLSTASANRSRPRSG